MFWIKLSERIISAKAQPDRNKIDPVDGVRCRGVNTSLAPVGGPRARSDSGEMSVKGSDKKSVRCLTVCPSSIVKIYFFIDDVEVAVVRLLS